MFLFISLVLTLGYCVHGQNVTEFEKFNFRDLEFLGIGNDKSYFYDAETNELSESVTNCTVPGYYCSNCTSLWYCAQLPGIGWLEQKVMECDDGETCFSSQGNCSSQPNPDCPGNTPGGNNFECHQVGVFPDVYSCGKYFMCIPDNVNGGVTKIGISVSCDKGYAFDPLTNQCSFKIVNNKCPYDLPSCTRIGQMGALARNPNLYYLCLRTAASSAVVPNLFRCPNNQIFNADTVSCVDNTPDSGILPNGLCKKSGNIYNPSDCFSYYYCAASEAVL